MLRTVSWIEIRSWEITLTCLKGWAILEIPRLWQITASSQCSTHHVEYWSPYAKESRPNLTPFGLYKYLRPPSGINLAPDEFESKLHDKLDGLPGVEVISDDILVMGYGENDDHENLLRLLERSLKRNISLNSSKMNLRKSEVRFLGHSITKNRLKPNPDKVKAVEMPKPQSNKELSSLLGFVNYLSKFLSSYQKLRNHWGT